VGEVTPSTQVSVPIGSHRLEESGLQRAERLNPSSSFSVKFDGLGPITGMIIRPQLGVQDRVKVTSYNAGHLLVRDVRGLVFENGCPMHAPVKLAIVSLENRKESADR
jgi:hypothetical protein